MMISAPLTLAGEGWGPWWALGGLVVASYVVGEVWEWWVARRDRDVDVDEVTVSVVDVI